MNGPQMVEKHPARAPEHPAGYLEALRSRLVAQRGRHLFIDDFNACAEVLHGDPMIPGDDCYFSAAQLTQPGPESGPIAMRLSISSVFRLIATTL